MPAYVKVNFVLFGLILAVFAYSYFFESLAVRKLTIPSLCNTTSNEFCKSEGLSRAFHALSHGNRGAAKDFNSHAFPIFIFFLAQGFLRIATSLLYLRNCRDTIIYADAIGSSLYFLIVFWALTPF
jgi:hypothetical protein